MTVLRISDIITLKIKKSKQCPSAQLVFFLLLFIYLFIEVLLSLLICVDDHSQKTDLKEIGLVVKF